MVHVHDDESEFDASLETIWKFLQSPEVHGPAHKSTRNAQVTPLGEATVLIEREQHMGGTWVKIRTRNTRFPPLGSAVEILEGPLAGSKFFTFYAPKGNRTAVTIVGEFTSPTLPPGEIETAARQLLEVAFNEDQAALKELGARK